MAEQPPIPYSGLFDVQTDLGVRPDDITDTTKPNQSMFFGSSFSAGNSWGLGRSLWEATMAQDWWDDPNVTKLDGQSAMDKYGLTGLDPKRQYSQRQIGELFRIQTHRSYNEQVIANYNAQGFDVALGLGAQFLGTASDPLELAVSAIPIGGPLSRAVLSIKTAGRTTKTFRNAALANRFLRRRPNFLGNAAAMGAIEGGGGNLLVSPAMMWTSDQTGREYELPDLATDTVFGAGLGAGLGLGASLLSRGARIGRNSIHKALLKNNISPEGHEAAKVKAMSDLWNGGEVNVTPIYEAHQRNKAPDIQIAETELNRAQGPQDLSPQARQTVESNLTDTQRHLFNALEEDLSAPSSKEPRLLNALRDVMETVDGLTADAITAAKAGDMGLHDANVARLMDVRDSVRGFLPDSEIERLNKLINKLKNTDTVGKARQGLSKSLSSISKAIDEIGDEGTLLKRLEEMALDANKRRQEALGHLKRAKKANTKAKWKNAASDANAEINRLNLAIDQMGGTTPVRNWVEAKKAGVDVDALFGIDPSLEALAPNVAYKRIKDQLLRKMRDLQVFHKQADPLTGKPLRKADNILAKEFKAAAKKNKNLTPDKFLEEHTLELEQLLANAEELAGISPRTKKTLEKIKEEFKQGKLHVEAVKKGSLQASICVLNGDV